MQNLLNGGTTYGVLTVQNSVGQTAYSIKTATGIQVAYGEITAPIGRFTGTGQTTHSLVVSSSIILGNNATETTGGISYLQSAGDLYISTQTIHMTAWVPWTPFTAACCGFATVPANPPSRYMRVGKMVIATHDSLTALGASNATSFTLTLPVAPANRNFEGYIQFTNNSVLSTAPGLIEIAGGSSTAALYTDWSGAAWAGGNNKGARFTIVYEAAQ